MTGIAVAMVCHNRRESTLRCLRHLFANRLPPECSLSVFLVDDGSSDGTAEAVRKQWPPVSITRGSGALYWNGGMRIAIEQAYASEADYVLWLNDDTLLDVGAVAILLATARAVGIGNGRSTIVVGTTVDQFTRQPTYGGVTFPIWWKRTTPRLVHPDGTVRPCETVNGNCVLVARDVISAIGNVDSQFVHGLGDFDFGLRARQRGFGVWVAPVPIGTCARNPHKDAFADDSLPLAQRLKMVLGPKGRPPRAWAVFTRRHYGQAWMLYWAYPYLRVIGTWLRRRIRCLLHLRGLT